MLSENGSACIRDLLLIGNKIWIQCTTNQRIPLSQVQFFFEFVIMNLLFCRVLFESYVSILSVRFGSSIAPISNFHQNNRSGCCSQQIKMNGFHLWHLFISHFADWSALSISEYAALFIVSYFNIWKCTNFCINITLNNQLWKHQHSRCECGPWLLQWPIPAKFKFNIPAVSCNFIESSWNILRNLNWFFGRIFGKMVWIGRF